MLFVPPPRFSLADRGDDERRENSVARSGGNEAQTLERDTWRGCEERVSSIAMSLASSFRLRLASHLTASYASSPVRGRRTLSFLQRSLCVLTKCHTPLGCAPRTSVERQPLEPLPSLGCVEISESGGDEEEGRRGSTGPNLLSMRSAAGNSFISNSGPAPQCCPPALKRPRPARFGQFNFITTTRASDSDADNLD